SQAWSHRGSRRTTFVANLRSDRSISTCPLGRFAGEDTDSVIKPVGALRGRALLRTNIKLATPAAAAANTEISPMVSHARMSTSRTEMRFWPPAHAAAAGKPEEIDASWRPARAK